MTLTYRQNDGEFYIGDHYEGIGYSGFGAGKNNPKMESARGIGPIPAGLYRVIECDPSEHPALAPPVFRLMPLGHDAYGRTGFLIHGNNKTNDASHGCIILGKAIRDRIKATLGADPTLEVFAVGESRTIEVAPLKPLMQSHQIKAGAIAVSSGVVGLADQFDDVRNALYTLVPYWKHAAFAIAMISVLSAAYMIWRRVHERRQGIH